MLCEQSIHVYNYRRIKFECFRWIRCEPHILYILFHTPPRHSHFGTNWWIKSTNLHIEDWRWHNIIALSCPYQCTDETVLHKNLANALTFINTTLFTLKYWYMFQPPRGHPWRVLIYFMTQVNKIHVPMEISD
jgi:hypothetical protein